MTTIDNVQDITPRVQYTATASQMAFTYPFPIFQDADIVVDQDGVTLTLTTDYTVIGEGDETGGTVTLVTAATVGDIITLYRDISIERDTDYQQNGPWASDATNNEFDKITLILQELEERVSRCLRIPMTADEVDGELTPIADYVGNFVGFNSSGEVVAKTVTESSVVTDADQITLDDSGGSYAAANVEAALAELVSASNGEGASMIKIEDSGGLLAATEVEGALAELSTLTAQLPQTKIANSTQAISSNTDLTDDSVFVDFDIVKLKSYSWEAYIPVSQNVGNFKFKLTFTNSPVICFAMLSIVEPDGTVLADYTDMETSAYEITHVTDGSGAGIHIVGSIKANLATTGTMKLQWAQETSSANSTSRNAGAWMRVAELN